MYINNSLLYKYVIFILFFPLLFSIPSLRRYKYVYVLHIYLFVKLFIDYLHNITYLCNRKLKIITIDPR